MPDDLAATLRALELQLMDPAVRHDRAQLELLLTEDFLEFGSSGRAFDRETIIAELTAEQLPLPPRAMADFRVLFATADLAHITYRSSGPAPDGSGTTIFALRSSLWVRQGAVWRIRFHQGTRCPAVE